MHFQLRLQTSRHLASTIDSVDQEPIKHLTASGKRHETNKRQSEQFYVQTGQEMCLELEEDSYCTWATRRGIWKRAFLQLWKTKKLVIILELKA